MTSPATRVVRGRDVVINTGATAAVPDLPGIAKAEAWTSETILRVERRPETLLILGGGYVGCEFASMFAVFGTRVTLLQGRDQVLPREDPDVAGQVAELATTIDHTGPAERFLPAEGCAGRAPREQALGR